MDRETIMVPRQEAEAAARLLAVLQHASTDPRTLAGANLSHFGGRQVRQYMHPSAAALMGDAGRAHTGNLVNRDWAQFSQPTVSDVHVDGPLTQISIMYRNSEFIGPMVLPRVQVSKRSDKYFTFGQSAWIRNDAGVRAPGAAASRTGYTVSTGNYSVETYSIEHQVPDELRQNADSPLAPDREGVMFCSDVLSLKLEKDVATEINTTANWTTTATLSGTSQWSDFSNSDPISDCMTAIRTVQLQIGRRPNTMVMGYQVYEKISQHPDFLDRVKYTGTQERPAVVSTRMVAELLGLETVLVGSAIEDSAIEGATASIAFVWGKHAWIGYVPPAAALNTPSAGYVFTMGRMVDRYREEGTKSDVLRAEEPWDVKVTAAGAGYRIISAVA